MSLRPIHEIFAEAFPLLGDVRGVLIDMRDAWIQLKEANPDAAEILDADAKIATLDEKIAAFDVAVEQADLVQIGVTALAELKNILKVGLTGKSHPHSTTGG